MGSAGEFGVGPQVARYLGFWGALAETCSGQNGLVSRNLYYAVTDPPTAGEHGFYLAEKRCLA